MKTNTFKQNFTFKNLVVPLVVMVAFVGVGNPKSNSKNLSSAGKCSLPPMTHSDFCGSA